MVDLKAEFKRLAGRPDAEYRGKQEESLKAVMQRRLRVLVVMATGAGKTEEQRKDLERAMVVEERRWRSSNGEGQNKRYTNWSG
ncbi:hypothetical protein P3342_008272 [Pyrenophora teres f. teres]|nr:hypothetical protein P3342_008272 [Pyrenophora teres f. teres]